jgi:GntR family transcriptional regulator
MTSITGTPAYLQVAEDLRQQIARGDLAPDAQLPSMTKLRESYGVSNTVIRDALNELRRDGLIVGQQGKGVYVRATGTRPASTGDLAKRLDELTSTVAELGQRVQTLEQASRPQRKH